MERMRAPLISVLVVFLLVLPPPSTTFRSFVPGHLQIPSPLPAEISSSQSVHRGEEVCALPPPDDDSSSLSAPVQVLPPYSHYTCEMPSPPAQTWVNQNKKVNGGRQTNVLSSLKFPKSLLLYVIFMMFILFYKVIGEHQTNVLSSLEFSKSLLLSVIFMTFFMFYKVIGEHQTNARASLELFKSLLLSVIFMTFFRFYKVIGEHQTNVRASLELWFILPVWLSLCLFVIFFKSIMFCRWECWGKQKKLNELANNTKVQHVTSRKKKAIKCRNNDERMINYISEKKKARKYRNNTSNDDNEKMINRPQDAERLNNQPVPGLQIGKLFVSDKVIGMGCNGTTVLEGAIHGHPVAVKRVLKIFHDFAWKEINHLKHPNIVRWYGVEENEDFVYIVVERSICSLHELILSRADSAVQLQQTSGVIKDFDLQMPNGYPSPALLKVMRDTITGLAYLHKLEIVHNNLKPNNILIQEEDGSISAKVSDMGISKRLPADLSCLTNATGCGSSGWLSPEQLSENIQSHSADLFSFGCLLFFCITGGQHPFGEKHERDMNILKGKKKLSLVADIPEVFDLISRLLQPNPKSRPRAAKVLNHPLFWESKERLEFLGHASDVLELNITPKLSKALKDINTKRKSCPAFDWGQQLDKTFFNHMKAVKRKHRSRIYDGKSIPDLLCFIRNTSNHYMGLPEQVQAMLGPYPEGCDSYFRIKFPKLLMEVYKVLEVDCELKDLKRYYKASI